MKSTIGSSTSRAKYPGDEARLARLSLIEEGPEVYAYGAPMCSHAVNGVAALHTELLKHKVLDFYELWPEKFNNKTNGSPTPLASNPKLAQLITEDRQQLD